MSTKYCKYMGVWINKEDPKNNLIRFLSSPPPNLVKFTDELSKKCNLDWAHQITYALLVNYDKGKYKLTGSDLIKEVLTYGGDPYFWLSANKDYDFFKEMERGAAMFGHDSVLDFINDVKYLMLDRIIMSFNRLKKADWK